MSLARPCRCPYLVELIGIEPTTSGLQSRRSPKLSYSPKGNPITSAGTSAGFLRQIRAPPQARSESYTRSSQRRVEEVSRSWRKKTSWWGTLDSN